mmetsp:Transcript_132920/g.265246  ORF Transcript_132920/g.265246 Transcript_132920/m.265246 type:complete len:499 (+) Transcript_132920:42-1538(+)
MVNQQAARCMAQILQVTTAQRWPRSCAGTHRWASSSPGDSKPQPWWAEELERRRQERTAPQPSPSRAQQPEPFATQTVKPTPSYLAEEQLQQQRQQQQQQQQQTRASSDGSSGSSNGFASMHEPEPDVDVFAGLGASKEQVANEAEAMRLFAYPASRRLPWATLLFLATSGGLTLAASAFWHLVVCGAQTVEELQPLLACFVWGVGACSVSKDQLAAGELHKLLTASLLHAGEQPTRLLADTAMLGCCGTLLERLHGSTFVLALGLGTTVLSNSLGLFMHSNMATVRGLHGADPASGRSTASVASSSGGIVAIGTYCAVRYGRWAAWRGLPLPAAWVLAPVVAADMSAGVDYFRQLREFKQAVLAAPEYIVSGGDSQSGGNNKRTVPDELADGTTANVADGEGLEESDGGIGRMPSGFELAVSLAACDSVEAQARTECRPSPEDVAVWRQELEQVAEVVPPSPPNGAVWTDIAGATLGLALAMVARGRVRLQPFRATR